MLHFNMNHDPAAHTAIDTDILTVFVYGTLMTGESNHDVFRPYALSMEPGRVLCRPCTPDTYPGLVLDEEGRDILGEWMTIDAAGLADLDRLEEYYGPGKRNDYERVTVRDLESGREGFTYVWNDSRGLPELTSGSWRRRKLGFTGL